MLWSNHHHAFVWLCFSGDLTLAKRAFDIGQKTFIRAWTDLKLQMNSIVMMILLPLPLIGDHSLYLSDAFMMSHAGHLFF